MSDGRSQLQGDDQKYDLIISEPSNPWIAGISNLFTQEFFAIAKLRLKPGGVLRSGSKLTTSRWPIT